MDRLLLISLAFIMIGMFGCEKNNEEDMDPNECDPMNVSYSSDIVPIIEDTCFPSCHNQNQPDGGYVFDSYDGFVQTVNNGRLLGAIRHEPGFVAMPQGKPQLPDCDIKTIAQWVDEGAMNN